MTDYEKGKRDATRKCAELMSKMIRCENCPIFCDWASEQKCADYLNKYLQEHIDDRKGQNESVI